MRVAPLPLNKSKEFGSEICGEASKLVPFPSFRPGHLRLRPPGVRSGSILKCRASQRVQTAYRATTPTKTHKIALRETRPEERISPKDCMNDDELVDGAAAVAPAKNRAIT